MGTWEPGSHTCLPPHTFVPVNGKIYLYMKVMVMSTAPTMTTMIIMTTTTMLVEEVVKFQFWFFKLTAYYRLKVTDSTIKPWCCPLILLILHTAMHNTFQSSEHCTCHMFPYNSRAKSPLSKGLEISDTIILAEQILDLHQYKRSSYNNLCICSSVTPVCYVDPSHYLTELYWLHCSH